MFLSKRFFGRSLRSWNQAVSRVTLLASRFSHTHTRIIDSIVVIVVVMLTLARIGFLSPKLLLLLCKLV